MFGDFYLRAMSEREELLRELEERPEPDCPEESEEELDDEPE